MTCLGGISSIPVPATPNTSVIAEFIPSSSADEDGMNSAMTDVFGVAGTGIELIPPRQVMGRVSYEF